MKTTLYATFTNAQDGIAAVESLLHHGMQADDINLILPKSQSTIAATVPLSDRSVKSTEHSSAGQVTMLSRTQKDALERMMEALVPEPPQLCAVFPSGLLPHHTDDPLKSDAPGYHYDALGAVIRDPVKPHATAIPPARFHEARIDTAEGAGLGLVFGMFAAMCVPGIGMIVGSGVIVAEIMAACTAAGGLAAGIYGYLIDRGVNAAIARKVSDHLATGSTTLSVSTTSELNTTEIAHIVKGFGGRLVHSSEYERRC